MILTWLRGDGVKKTRQWQHLISLNLYRHFLYPNRAISIVILSSSNISFAYKLFTLEYRECDARRGKCGKKFLHKKSLYLISSMFLFIYLPFKQRKKVFAFIYTHRHTHKHTDDNTEIRMLSIGYSGLQFAIKLVLVSFTSNRI